jgi:segregation and condensation protein B
MSPLPDDSSPTGKHREDASLQQLNDAFNAMLKSDGAQDPDPSQQQETGSIQSPALQKTNTISVDSELALIAESGDENQSPVTPKRVLEAMLFVGHPENKPLTKEQIVGVIHGVKPGEVEGLIAELREEYSAQGCTYDIRSEGSGFRLALRDQYERVHDRFYGQVREAKLSQAAVEVLALVAYNQPTTSDKISKLRGHPSRSILSQLVRRQLLRVERPEKKPRTPTYQTTPRFLKLFGLASLEELPKSQDLES